MVTAKEGVILKVYENDRNTEPYCVNAVMYTNITAPFDTCVNKTNTKDYFH